MGQKEFNRRKTARRQVHIHAERQLQQTDRFSRRELERRQQQQRQREGGGA